MNNKIKKRTLAKKKSSPTKSRTGQLLPIPSKIRRLGERLLDQQMWCWGIDVRCDEGNKLVAYGFTRQPPPEGSRGHSSYVFFPYTECQVHLWGSGLFYGDQNLGGLFLKRYEFKPKLTENALLPISNQAIETPVAHSPRTPQEANLAQQLLHLALTWISSYEQWINETMGPDYRQQCLQKWHKKPIVTAEMMRETWQQLAQPATNART